MPTVKLRPYQEDLCKEVWRAIKEHSGGGSGVGVMVQLPTGGGKTAIGCDLLHQFVTRLPDHVHGWVTNRRELRVQSGERLEDYGLDVVSLSDLAPNDRHWFYEGVNIVSPSLRKWPVLPEKCGLLIVDEAHHVPAKTWARLVALWLARGGIIIGLTATPWRLSRQQGFDKWFDELVCGPTVMELQTEGWLATPKVVFPQHVHVDTSNARVASTGDYDYTWMEEEISMLLAHEPVAEYWEELTADYEDRRTLWFVPTVVCAEALVQRLGKSARMLTAKTPSVERDDILTDLEDQRLVHLVSVDVISEGLDIPAVPLIASLRPTQSVAVWLQQCGRGSRPKAKRFWRRSAPGGYYTVIDYAGNAQRHGTPDEDRIWSLEARAKHSGGKMQRPESHCYMKHTCEDVVLHPSSRSCWNCEEEMWFECSECHVHRRWTQFAGSKDNRVCAKCRQAEKDRRYAENIRSTDSLLSKVPRGSGVITDRQRSAKAKWAKKESLLNKIPGREKGKTKP